MLGDAWLASAGSEPASVAVTILQSLTGMVTLRGDGAPVVAE